MKTSTFTLLCALLASAITGSDARPQPTAAPLEQRSNALSPRQQDASAIVASISESPDAFMSSVTASDSTTAFSQKTGFACKGLQGSSGCCDTGVYVNRRCWVVPGAPEGLSFYGNTDDYVPGQDDDDAASSSSASASSSGTASQSSSAASTSGSSSSSNSSSSQATSSAAAASSPSATSQSGGSNDGHSLQASLGLMAASFLGLAVAL